MPDRILFRGVRLVDPASEHDGVTDVMVEDETIAVVGEGLDAPAGTETIDGDGLVMAVLFCCRLRSRRFWVISRDERRPRSRRGMRRWEYYRTSG